MDHSEPKCSITEQNFQDIVSANTISQLLSKSIIIVSCGLVLFDSCKRRSYYCTSDSSSLGRARKCCPSLQGQPPEWKSYCVVLDLPDQYNDQFLFLPHPSHPSAKILTWTRLSCASLRQLLLCSQFQSCSAVWDIDPMRIRPVGSSLTQSSSPT